jgi:hypothetical protein
MRLRHTAPQDPRWHELVRDYKNNWVKACRELFGITLTPQQRQIIDNAELPGPEVAISAGSGVGAHSALAAVGILTVILTEQTRTILVRPPSGIVAAARYRRYILEHWNKLLKVHPWLDIYFKVTEKVFEERSNPCWGMYFQSARVGAEEALAGEHCNQHLTIVLHASGVPDNSFRVIRAGMCDEKSGLIMLSQPTRNEGYFHDAHQRLSKTNGGIFTALTLNAEDSPLVSSDFIEFKRQEYGGPDSDEYRIKVQGRFPLKGKA